MNKKMLKNILKKNISLVLIAVVILFAEFKVVDFHRDGILIRDRYYVIRPEAMSGYQMNVDNNSLEYGARVGIAKTSEGANQPFYITYIGDGKYGILYNNPYLCIGVDYNGTDLVVSPCAGNPEQLWEIKRVGNSQNFLFTSCANGKTMCYVYVKEENYYKLCVEDYNKDSAQFNMQLYYN